MPALVRLLPLCFAVLNAAIAEALALPDVQARLAQLSAEHVGMGPSQMAIFMKQDAERWRNAIRAAGLKPGDL
jgi:tripartite-type tricarboxylate transporter receptor subunit TctC